jgi:glycosyltransferase involved in cell wall biosynthesis
VKTNITYIVSNINKALAFEWIAMQLNKEQFNIHFILLNAGDSELETFLNNKNVPVERITYRGKKDVLTAMYRVAKILRKNKTTIVHTHLFDANIVGLIAAWLVGIKKRIHTRHHSNYHHLYHPQAVKYDKWVNRFSTDIVAISEVVKELLIKTENVSPQKVTLIHHGFPLNEFTDVAETSVQQLQQKYNPTAATPVIGVIARYTEWKGIQYIIPAFKNILATHPNALLLLANAHGDYKATLQAHLQTLPQKNYIELPFESDIFSLYQLFDVFVHVPITAEIEAFGQTYIEALAAGIPSVFSLSGIANEFIKDRENALVVPPKNSALITAAILELLTNKDLANQLTINGKTDVNKLFGLTKMILSLESLYKK